MSCKISVALLFATSCSLFLSTPAVAQPYGYMAIQDGATISIFDGTGGVETGYWPAQGIVSGLVFAPNGSAAYATVNPPEGIRQVNPVTHSLVRKIAASNPQLLTINPNGALLYAVVGQDITAFDTTTGASSAQVALPSGSTASWLTVSPDGKTVYAVLAPLCQDPPSCGNLIDVTAYDSVTLSFLRTLKIRSFNPPVPASRRPE